MHVSAKQRNCTKEFLGSGANCTAEQLVQWSNLYSGATCTVEQLVQHHS